jgi:glycerol-3-phosphate cytidylyltransferase
MIYCFDIDGTICSERPDNNYNFVEPHEEVIFQINSLYDSGNKIILFTHRHLTWPNQEKFTREQLKKWGVKYHELIYNKKPQYDVFIDSKAMNSFVWRNEVKNTTSTIKVGFVASCFDLLHAGHCLMLEDAKRQCDHLIAALQTDPSIDRPEKNKPIQSLQERMIQLQAVKYVDEIKSYETEEDLRILLKRIMPDVRILGSDWEGKEYTGEGIAHSVYFHSRSHDFSTSELKERVKNG